MRYQLVSQCYISHQTNYVSRPCNPRVILSEAAPPAKNHVRQPNIAAQSNPAPSGAPAGGISLAERYHIKHRTTPFVRVPGWRGALRGAFRQRRSRLRAPRQGGGVRLRGAVWLSRSPLHPVCRFAQDDTVGEAAREAKNKKPYQLVLLCYVSVDYRDVLI